MMPVDPEKDPRRASGPIPILQEPLDTKPACAPIKTLLTPVVLVQPAHLPAKMLSLPVVTEHPA